MPPDSPLKKIKVSHDKLERDFSKHLVDNYELELSCNPSSSANRKEEVRKDLQRFIQIYRQYVLNTFSEEPADAEVINLMGLDFDTGFNLLYGPPDTAKTIIAANIANEANKKGFTVCFVDAQNHLYPGILDDGVIYLKGKADVHQIIRRMVSNHTVDFIIIDTIVAMSRYDDTMRSLVKYLTPFGIYCLLINQTRNWRYGQYSAGTDTIEEMSRSSYRIVSKRTMGSTTYVRTDNKVTLVFREEDDHPVYDEDESKLATLLNLGEINKIRRKYIYQGEEYDKDGIKQVISSRDWGDISTLLQEEV